MRQGAFAFFFLLVGASSTKQMASLLSICNPAGPLVTEWPTMSRPTSPAFSNSCNKLDSFTTLADLFVNFHRFDPMHAWELEVPSFFLQKIRSLKHTPDKPKGWSFLQVAWPSTDNVLRWSGRVFCPSRITKLSPFNPNAIHLPSWSPITSDASACFTNSPAPKLKSSVPETVTFLSALSPCT